jgi:hypothetical protein
MPLTIDVTLPDAPRRGALLPTAPKVRLSLAEQRDLYLFACAARQAESVVHTYRRVTFKPTLPGFEKPCATRTRNPSHSWRGLRLRYRVSARQRILFRSMFGRQSLFRCLNVVWVVEIIGNRAISDRLQLLEFMPHFCTGDLMRAGLRRRLRVHTG